MRLTTTAAFVLGLGVMTGTAAANEVGVDGYDTLTEWKVPFTTIANPFQIAMAGDDVVYLRDDAPQHLGRLEVDRGRFTEWPLPYQVTSPGDIKVRATDGAVFIAGLSDNEIGQFDLQTQTLRRWPLPLDVEFGGPRSLAIDGAGRVLFTGYNSVTALIGRLDTTDGTLTTWEVPAAIGDATRLTVTPDGTVFFNDNADPFSLGSLDPNSGAFVSWGLTGQPAFAIISDAVGDIFFQYGGLGRFSPGTGRLTYWDLPGPYNEDMTKVAGRVFMGAMSPDGMAVGMEAVDVSQPGADTTLIPSVSEVAVPTTVVVTSSTSALKGKRAHGQVSTRLVRRRHQGAVSIWVIPERPRMVAGTADAVFFGSTGQTEPVIGRLTR